ncbi:MAG: hypothetical protein H7A34_08110 [bacterium]|nr:hypothetical protein [bacterium]
MMPKNYSRSNGNVLFLMLIFLCSIILAAIVVFGIIMIKQNQSRDTQNTHEVQTQNTAYLEYSAMMDQLQDKSKLLQDKENELALQASRIKKLESELLATRSELEKIQRETQEQFSLLQESEKKNLKKLAKVYALMEPVQAAPILSALDDDTIINILTLMKERNAARLLGGFAAQNPEMQKRAALISEKMRSLATTTTSSAQ